MRFILGSLGAFLAGSIGWWLGSKAGVGTGLILSVVGSGAGMFVGYRWFDQNLK